MGSTVTKHLPISFLEVNKDYQIMYGCFQGWFKEQHWTWYSINTRDQNPSSDAMAAAKAKLQALLPAEHFKAATYRVTDHSQCDGFYKWM